MLEIKLKKNGLPTRCEICHQTDLFDSVNNYCARCSTVQIFFEENKNSSNRLTFYHHILSFFRNFGISLGETLSLFLFILFPVIGACLVTLVANFFTKTVFFWENKENNLFISFGLLFGFLALLLLGKVTIKLTNMKLAHFIDRKIELLIKKASIK